jgi:hypothetical protein
LMHNPLRISAVVAIFLIQFVGKYSRIPIVINTFSL